MKCKIDVFFLIMVIRFVQECRIRDEIGAFLYGENIMVSAYL